MPVHWVEDNDSRVRIVSTAIDDLRGIWRLSCNHSPGATSALADTQDRIRALETVSMTSPTDDGSPVIGPPGHDEGAA